MMADSRQLFVLALSLCMAALFSEALTQELTLSGTEGTLRTRVGCRVVVTCSGVGVDLTWRRFGSREPINANVTRNGAIIQSDLIFDPVDATDRGAYTCEIQRDFSENPHFTSRSLLLFVDRDPIEVQLTDTNIDISTYAIGETVSIPCPISTCHDNVQVMLLKEGELIEEGTLTGDTLGRVYNFNLEVTESTVGTYTCKATLNGDSDMADFDITDKTFAGKLCVPSCLNGNCVDGECVCPSGYTGSDCGVPLELDLYFTNDTPLLFGNGTIIAEIGYTPRPGLTVQCHIPRLDSSGDDCSTGRFERNDIPPGDYTLRVVARDPSTGERAVIRSSFRISGDNTYCTVVLINRGVTVDGNNATVEFAGSGIVSQHVCSVDRQEYMPCQSPFTVTGLDPGPHFVKINPTDCGRNYRATRAKFNIN